MEMSFLSLFLPLLKSRFRSPLTVLRWDLFTQWKERSEKKIYSANHPNLWSCGFISPRHSKSIRSGNIFFQDKRRRSFLSFSQIYEGYTITVYLRSDGGKLWQNVRKMSCWSKRAYTFLFLRVTGNGIRIWVLMWGLISVSDNRLVWIWERALKPSCCFCCLFKRITHETKILLLRKR